MDMATNHLPLFETKTSNRRLFFRLYAAAVAIGIIFIFAYRIRYCCFPQYGIIGIGLFLSEAWFTLYWTLSIIVRWNPIHRITFKERLSLRYDDKDLPGVDIFVCTADPVVEPPIMVINTVLSVMAYDYPPEKLSVYLSDDGGSDLTFYAMLEAATFSKIWLPFCRKFKVEPRSPEAYFLQTPIDSCEGDNKDLLTIKKSYEDMKDRIETTTKFSRIPNNLHQQHKGFSEWSSVSSKNDHQTILQILIDGKRDPTAVDDQGQPLPTLVYLAREKRPQHHHNFKAGAMNALIRVSSKISNGPLILNVDCDMYSNNSKAIRDALCFFMDEAKGQDIAYIQYPQSFCNLTKNEIYGNSLRVIMEVDLPGFDGNGGPCYIGTGCFHRRDTLCGKMYSKESRAEWKSEEPANVLEELANCTYEENTDWGKKKGVYTEEPANVLEESSKELANCTYEENTEWGKKKGVIYGSLVEDILTGLSIKYRGWRSMYFNPERKSFLGISTTTLLQCLTQHKRWAEGEFQIFLSKHCPVIAGHKRIPLKLQLSYCIYLLWAPSCLAMLYYVIVPSLFLLQGKALFPKVSSHWMLPFPYVLVTTQSYSLWEFLRCGGTVQGWWNELRISMFKTIASYSFALLSIILKVSGFSKTTFAISEKVTDEEVSRRYEHEVMEFGTNSPMFKVIATIAILNLLSFIGGLVRVVVDMKTEALDLLGLQILLSGLLVCLNRPVYEGLFFRKDSGRMPNSVTLYAIIFAMLACTIAMY